MNRAKGSYCTANITFAQPSCPALVLCDTDRGTAKWRTTVLYRMQTVTCTMYRRQSNVLYGVSSVDVYHDSVMCTSVGLSAKNIVLKRGPACTGSDHFTKIPQPTIAWLVQYCKITFRVSSCRPRVGCCMIVNILDLSLLSRSFESYMARYRHETSREPRGWAL